MSDVSYEEGSLPSDGIVASQAVARWFSSAGYDAASEADRRALLDDLEAFCAYAGDREPDELVRSCFRIGEGGTKAISVKGRREMQETIEAFVAHRGLSGHAGTVMGNRIRSFLIHNGVFMQGVPSFR